MACSLSLDQHFAEPTLGIELQLGCVGDHAAVLGLARIQLEALRRAAGEDFLPGLGDHRGKAALQHCGELLRHGRQLAIDTSVKQAHPKELLRVGTILFARLAAADLAHSLGLDRHGTEPPLGIELQLGGVGDHAAVLGLARVQLPCELARKRGAAQAPPAAVGC